MKVKLTRPQIVTRPEVTGPNRGRRAALVRKFAAGGMTRRQLTNSLFRLAQPGEEIEHPKAYLLVLAGIAEPVDLEAKNRTAHIPAERLDAMQAAAIKLERRQSLPSEFADLNLTDDEADENAAATAEKFDEDTPDPSPETATRPKRKKATRKKTTAKN